MATVHQLHPKSQSTVPAAAPQLSEEQKEHFKAAQSVSRLHKEIRELEKLARVKAKQMADIRKELNMIERWSFGDWWMAFKPREVKSVPPKTPANRIWTWVDGPKFDGDIDTIIPGHIEGLAIKLYITEIPHPESRMKVACY